MAEYDIRTLQLHILKILKEIDRVCKKHDIRYYLADGSMLGAIRHGGFIPWDDDADIMMPRPDYIRFMEHAKEWLPSPLEAVCVETTHRYPGFFGKVIDSNTTVIEREHYADIGGVFVDVFPIDGMPSNKLLQRIQLMRHGYYKKILYLIHRNPYKNGHGFSSWIPLLLRKLYSHDKAHRAMRRVMTQYEFENHDIVVNYDDGKRGIMPKKFYGIPTPISFEGQTLMGVERPHEYLTHTYGEYMRIPPVEQQRVHGFFFLDYEHSYKDYDDRREFMQE